MKRVFKGTVERPQGFHIERVTGGKIMDQFNTGSRARWGGDMPGWIEMTDELGPEKILHVYDPVAGLEGVVVVDTTSLGGMGGGIRMLPDITTAEIFQLARAMTYKFNTLGVPIGGAKSGIWADPSIQGGPREVLLRSFGHAIRPLLSAGLSVGADMGTDAKDLATIYEGAGLPWRSTGLVMQEKDGEPLENHATGYGVVVAARAACEFAGMDIRGATVAIEGFGKAAGGVARYMMEEGARVVAMSTIHGAIYNEGGLDVHRLLDMRKESADMAVQTYDDAEHVAKEEIYSLPVDILVPGARPYVIDPDNADQVQAKVISSIANIPVTDEGEEMLFRRGIHSVPDFISNAGGVVVAIVDFLGGTADDVFRALRDLLGQLTRDALAEAQKEGINPRSLAVRRAKERVLSERTAKSMPSLEEALKVARDRFKIC